MYVVFGVDDFLGACVGDKQHPMRILIPLTVFHCIVFVTGIVGNLLGEYQLYIRN